MKIQYHDSKGNEITTNLMIDAYRMYARDDTTKGNWEVLWEWKHSEYARTSLVAFALFRNADWQDITDGFEHQRLSDAVAEFLHEFAPNECGDTPTIMKKLAQKVRDGKR